MMFIVSLVFLLLIKSLSGFHYELPRMRISSVSISMLNINEKLSNSEKTFRQSTYQRTVSIARSIASLTAATATVNTMKADASTGAKEGKFEYQPALEGLDYGKPRTYYPDFVQKPSGLQYKMMKEGVGATPSVGDKVVIDWEGYTIGYYGRPFEVRNKVKGGAFDSTETDYFRWVIGSGQAIQALDEGLQYMKEGGIAQIIIPAELGYPKGDPNHDLVGPKPSSFSGERALNFVLDNKNLIDKTLLINVKLVKIEKGFADKKKKG